MSENTTNIQQLPVDELVVMGINPRVIKDDKFRKLQQSILKDPDFMSLRPILINKVGDDLNIYAGAQRYKACKELGWETVPCIVDEDLPEPLMKARMLRDNVHAGEWDVDKLNEFDTSMLDNLDISGMDGKIKWANEGDEDKTKKKTADKDSTQSHGGHFYMLIFATKDEKAAFQMVEDGLPNDVRLEDHLIKKAKKFLSVE